MYILNYIDIYIYIFSIFLQGMNLHNKMHRKINSIIRTCLIWEHAFGAESCHGKTHSLCLPWNVWCAAVSPVTQRGLSAVAGDMRWYVRWVKVKWFQSLNRGFMHNGRRVFILPMSFRPWSCMMLCSLVLPSSGDHAACRFHGVVEPGANESNLRVFWQWAAWQKHTASQRNATRNVQTCRICIWVI